MRLQESWLLEAAGIEPLFPINTNPMMSHDHGFYCRRVIEFARRFEFPPVPWSPPPFLEIYWRRKSPYIRVRRHHLALRLKAFVGDTDYHRSHLPRERTVEEK